jgi:hypothetical protein
MVFPGFESLTYRLVSLDGYGRLGRRGCPAVAVIRTHDGVAEGRSRRLQPVSRWFESNRHLLEGPKGVVLCLESAEVGVSRRVGSSPAPSAQNAILLVTDNHWKDYVEHY